MNNNLIATAKEFANGTLAPFFKSIGFELEFFQETDEMKDLWQYDGYDYGNGYFIQFTVGINGHHLPMINGDVELPDGRGFSISGSCRDWMENYGEGMKRFAKGEAPF